MSGELLGATGIEKSFGYRKLLKGLDLGLGFGECLLLLGRNGEGKSTLLKILTGLMRPEGGLVRYRNQPIQDAPEEYRSNLGVISHQAHLYNELTATENLAFFAQLRQIPHLPDKIRQALVTVGLEPFAHARTGNFSSGMKKRLNIAKLMICEPEILLLDEPYTGLDYESIDFFNEFLTSFKAAGGSMIMVTHQIDLCYPLADQIQILRNGRLNAIDKHAEHSYEQLLAQYQEISA